MKIGELEAIYHNYQEINLTHRSSINPRPRSSMGKENRTTATATERDSRRLYNKIKNDLEDSVIESDARESMSSTSRKERPVLRHKSFSKENIRKGNVALGRLIRDDIKDFEKRDNSGYSYNNLINVLDMKVKSDANISNTMFIQKEVTKSRATRAKMTNVFSEHSKWLQDMKDQVFLNCENN